MVNWLVDNIDKKLTSKNFEDKEISLINKVLSLKPDYFLIYYSLRVIFNNY